MDNIKLQESIETAKRFLQRAKDYEEAVKELQKTECKKSPRLEAGALRRASLDLSASLAKLRKP